MLKFLKSVCTLAFVCLVPSVSFAQNKLTATLVDASNSEPVAFATVYITKAGQTDAYKYSLSSEEGKVAIEGVKKGNYVFSAEIMGYKPFSKEIEVPAGNFDLGTLKLDPDTELLKSASVSAVGNPVIVKKDTVEYSASSFKTTDNDVLEDLLKKLPGVEVGEDGSITWNGETINKVTLNGKTFFLDDPQLASKNIPAKMVEKLKVIEKKSEQSEFSGIDDGEHEFVLDLGIQKNMMKGAFGNVMGGVGHDVPADNVTGDTRYQFAGFGGNFKDASQISIVVNANNTNNRGFNDLSGNMMGGMMGGGGMMGRGMGGWGGRNGITTSYMGGINGAWTLFDDRMDLGANYLYNHTGTDVEESKVKNTYLEDRTLNYFSNGVSNSVSDGHRIGMRLEHKFSENTNIIFQPQVNFGTGSYAQSSVDSTYQDMAGSVEKLNSAYTNNTGNNRNVNASGFVLFRQRLGAPGRTITAMANYRFSDNRLEGLNDNATLTFDGGEASSPVKQSFESEQKSSSVWSRITYTEPLGHDFYVEANYSYSWNRSASDKNTIDLFTGEQAYDYSNEIVNVSTRQEIGANLLYQKDGAHLQLGFAAMPIRTYNSTTRWDAVNRTYDPKTYTDKHWNYAPQGMMWWEFNDNSSIRVFYRGSSNQPSTSQLMPVPDNSNPLNIGFGNPTLLPYFEHSVRGDFRYSNKQKMSSFNIRFNGGLVNNPIVSALWYGSNGAQYTMPFNGPRSANAGFGSFLNMPFGQSGLSINNMLRANWSTSSSYVSSGSVPMDTYDDPKKGFYDFMDEFIGNDYIDKYFEVNTTKTVGFTERMKFTYRMDDFEASLSGRTRMNHSWYTISTLADETTTWNNQLRAELNWTFSNPGITVKSDMNYNWYRGYETPQEDEYVLNAEIQKLLCNKKLTLALKGYDILGQSKNLFVTDQSNYHQETLNNTLGRYIILSLTYRFGTFDQSRMGGPGGPGGPRR